ncbi:hypothetical protein GCM10009798_00300 [Nocardioides panacihumi]|uniref:DUF5666 domain-containing protein n=1 Tax=Nocardioides panacihumi TaxID=400774 RepID=A0ABN2Q631_9ACTN
MSDSPHPSDAELLARLRGADPAGDLPAADADDVDHLLHRVVDTDLRETGTHRRNSLTWLVAAAAVVVIAGGVVWRLSGDHSQPGVVAAPGASTTAAAGTTELSAAPATGGRCIVPTPELLAAKPLAFEGKVVGIADGVVTIRPTKIYTGDAGDQVTVTGAAPGAAGAPEGDPAFETGQDYLVAAEGGRVLGCGLSGPVGSPEVKALYEQAFPQ